MNEKIEEFRALPKRDGKNALADYAMSTFNIDLNKKLTFDNMLVELQEAMTPAEEVIETITPSVIETPETAPEQSEPESDNDMSTKDEAVPEVIPDNFKPTLRLQGSNVKWCPVPHWIYKWMCDNDWKAYPEKCPFYGAENILRSLKYYIMMNGEVIIRETSNSKFITLK